MQVFPMVVFNPGKYNFTLQYVLQEVDVAGKKAIIMFVPVPQIRAFQKIQVYNHL